MILVKRCSFLFFASRYFEPCGPLRSCHVQKSMAITGFSPKMCQKACNKSRRDEWFCGVRVKEAWLCLVRPALFVETVGIYSLKCWSAPQKWMLFLSIAWKINMRRFFFDEKGSKSRTIMGSCHQHHEITNIIAKRWFESRNTWCVNSSSMRRGQKAWQ